MQQPEAQLPWHHHRDEHDDPLVASLPEPFDEGHDGPGDRRVLGPQYPQRHPGVPARPLAAQFPGSLGAVPGAVPAGTRTVTLPSNVGTVMVVPRAASGKVMGTFMVRFRPLRPIPMNNYQ